jgi:hypothetical protein
MPTQMSLCVASEQELGSDVMCLIASSQLMKQISISKAVIVFIPVCMIHDMSSALTSSFVQI